MEFNQKKLGIIMAAAIVIGASTLGGYIYSSHKTDAREVAEKQALIASIDAQHEKEYQAQQVKADAPVINEEHPARIVPAVTAQDAPKPTVKPSTPTPATTQTTSQPASTTTTTVKEIPQQSPAPLQVEPTIIPSAPAKQDPVPAITALSDSDIQRLQSYTQYSTAGGKTSEIYISFEKMYADPQNRADCDWLMKAFSPITLGEYFGMKAEWLTSPKLVYQSVIGQFCVRGILTLTAYDDNKLGLTPNVKYQSNVEYRLVNAVKNGKITLSLDSIHYLSGFQAVK